MSDPVEAEEMVQNGPHDVFRVVECESAAQTCNPNLARAEEIQCCSHPVHEVNAQNNKRDKRVDDETRYSNHSPQCHLRRKMKTIILEFASGVQLAFKNHT